ncbi:MAG: hypothetical protein ACR2PZ_26170 [Pseudomonadales bacterium]
MTEATHCDRLQQLEQKHLQLIEELDVLNTRLEQALETFSNQRLDEAKTSPVD